MSFCSNYQGFTQSQKMSIGLRVDSALGKRGASRSTKGAADDKEASSKAPHLTAQHDSVANNCKDDAQYGSVRVTASSRPAVSKSSRGIRLTHTDVPANQTLSQAAVDKQIDADSLSGKRGVADGRSAAFASALGQQESKPNDMEDRSGKEALKMKLREVLGMDASANDKSKVVANEMRQDQVLEGDPHFKRARNSDAFAIDKSGIFDVGANETRQDQVLEGDPHFKCAQNSDASGNDKSGIFKFGANETRQDDQVLERGQNSDTIEEDNSDFSNDSDTPQVTPAVAQESSREDKDAGTGFFTLDGEDSDSTQEASSAEKVYSKDIHISSEIGLVEKPMFFRNKRHCSHGFDYDDVSPTSATPKGGSTGDVLTESFEKGAADGFTRIISLLGLGLEKVKSKMTLATNKRCSEILMSAAEEIHSQLQNVESQIQTDLGKLASLKTSKRKHLETRLQEQQENLKVIHEKFKKEIHKYLQDCRSALEGLETQHVELKGAVERQKASHRKLLLQVEAAVETHLIDARRQIVSVHKSGKKKMQQLKVAVAECLKDEFSG